VEQTTERLAIVRELVIDASPETVWEFLVDPDKILRWKGIEVALDPKPGGVFRCVVIPGHTARGEVVEVDRPNRLVYTWGWEEGGVAPGSTTIEYELVPEGSGTRLKFTHRDFADQATTESHTAGWDHYLPRLAVAAPGGDPGPDPWLTERSN